MTIAIGTYIKLFRADGSATNHRFQNFHQGENREYDSQIYMFAAFGFSGGTLDLQAANISASLVFSLNSLSLSTFQQAADERWIARIRTVWLDPETFDETGNHSEEIYAITGLNHDTSRLSVALGSPLDAVQQNAPRRVLTTSLVGSLPSTGELNLN